MTRLLLRKRSKSRLALAFASLLILSFSLSGVSAEAAFFKKTKKKPKAEKVIELQTSLYRVYYLSAEPQKKPELGTGDYCEIQYKAVFQEDWISNPKRLIQIDFLDFSGYIAARDVVSDKDFNAQGERYGYLWVSCDLVKTIQKVEVREVFQKGKASQSVAPKKIPLKRTAVKPEKFDRKKYFEEKSPELKELFQKPVLTEKDIEQALLLTRHGGSAAVGDEGDKKEKTEDGEDVSLETSFA